MLKNKNHQDNLYVFVGYVWQTWKEEKEREKENKKAETIKQSWTWKRVTDSKLEQEKKSKLKFKEASHLPISPVRDQLW